MCIAVHALKKVVVIHLVFSLLTYKFKLTKDHHDAFYIHFFGSKIMYLNSNFHVCRLGEMWK